MEWLTHLLFCNLPTPKTMNLLLSVLLNGVLVYFLSWLLPGVEAASYLTAVLAGIVLTLANAIVRPILSLIALPITLITLGLFQLVINGLMVLLASMLVSGFVVENIWWGLLFAVLLSILNGILGNNQAKKAS
jgi:putative membrane protein